MSFSRGMDRVAIVAAVLGAVVALGFVFVETRRFVLEPQEWVPALILAAIGGAVSYWLIRLIKWIVEGFMPSPR